VTSRHDICSRATSPTLLTSTSRPPNSANTVSAIRTTWARSSRSTVDVKGTMLCVQAFAPKVRVNTFRPGLHRDRGHTRQGDWKSGRGDTLRRMTPMGRVPRPAELADAAHMTGGYGSVGSWRFSLATSCWGDSAPAHLTLAARMSRDLQAHANTLARTSRRVPEQLDNARADRQSAPRPTVVFLSPAVAPSTRG
jgi:hypothetical protein